MTNNDIFCALRTTFAFNDQTLLEIFHLADNETTPAQLASWLSKPQAPEFAELSDPQLASFLNGLINLKRGKREGEAAKPEANLNNNMVFQKLRIALNLQADDLLTLFQQVGVELSKTKSALFSVSRVISITESAVMQRYVSFYRLLNITRQPLQSNRKLTIVS